MKVIELTNDEVMDILSAKKEIVGKGYYGILSVYDDNTLIKLYYKDIINTYTSLDPQKLDKEINDELQVIKTFKELGLEISDRYERINIIYKHLQNTNSNLLIKGIVTYKNYVLGVLLKYYKDYNNLTTTFEKLSHEEQIKVLKRVQYLLNELMENNIYPIDLREDNILINKSNLDVKLIDLDDNEIRIEDKFYIEKHFEIKQGCLDKYNAMEKRLLRNK